MQREEQCGDMHPIWLVEDQTKHHIQGHFKRLQCSVHAGRPASIAVALMLHGAN